MPVYVSDNEISYSHHFLEYSEDPDTLLHLLENITITMQRGPVVPAPWGDDSKYDALLYFVTVSRDGRSYSFQYYASHNDAQAYKATGPLLAKARRDHVYGLPYGILCSIGLDYTLSGCDPEDMGLNPDSIKDMSKWNEIKAHSRELQQCLRLTEEERASLPS